MHTAPVGFFQGANDRSTVSQLGFILMTTEQAINKDIIYPLISVNQGFQP